MSASSNVITPDEDGLWIGVDLGTSNCACAIWDSTRGRPKWLRLGGDLRLLASPEGSNKAGRIVPSAVVLLSHHADSTSDEEAQKKKTKKTKCLMLEPSIVEQLDKLRDDDDDTTTTTTTKSCAVSNNARVGYAAVKYSLQNPIMDDTSSSSSTEEQQQQQQSIRPTHLVTSVKRVLGVCDTTRLQDMDPIFRKSLPFSLVENKQGQWVIPIVHDDSTNSNNDTMIHYIRPIHVAAILLQAIRSAAQTYLQKAIPQKDMVVPGGSNSNDNNVIRHVVVGVPAYFGQPQRQAIEQAARWAGFSGHVSTLTESTAAAMAYGLFVSTAVTAANHEKLQKAIMVLDMGGGTTDVTLAEVRNTNSASNEKDDDEQPQFEVVLTEGDGRLGGDDMDQAVLELVLQKLQNQQPTTTEPVFQGTQRQTLLRQCKELKETLCGDVDHGDPPEDKATIRVTIPAAKDIKQQTVDIVVTLEELEIALEPLLERAAQLVKRSLQRYAEKRGKQEIPSPTTPVTQEVILIGGATRVPALRKMLRDRFFPPPHHPELCTSVNAMSAVAQGAAIQAAILSQQVPLHEVRSAMMLDITPHAIGVLLTTPTKADDDDNFTTTTNTNFIEILPRDTPLPAFGCAPFTLADIDQQGVTVVAAERLATAGAAHDKHQQYQQVGEFTILLHQLSKTQKEELIQDHDGRRTVEIGMSLKNNGEFRVSVFDDRDPEHVIKKEIWQEYHRQVAASSDDKETDNDYTLDYAPVKPMDLWQASEGITRQEAWMLFLCSLLFVFYIFVRLLIADSPEESARIL